MYVLISFVVLSVVVLFWSFFCEWEMKQLIQITSVIKKNHVTLLMLELYAENVVFIAMCKISYYKKLLLLVLWQLHIISKKKENVKG